MSEFGLAHSLLNLREYSWTHFDYHPQSSGKILMEIFETGSWTLELMGQLS